MRSWTGWTGKKMVYLLVIEHAVFGNTFCEIYASENLYNVDSKLTALRILVSEVVAILENGHHNHPRHNLVWH